MKKLICTVLALILCLSLLSVTALAAGESATLTGPGTVRAGDTITLSLNLSGNGVFGASGTLSYDAGQLTLVGTNQAIGNGWAVEFNGNNFVAYDNNLTSPINGTATLFTVTFRVNNVNPGIAITVSYNSVTASDGSADANIGTVSYSATVAQPLSGDNSLKAMSVSNATISPAFNPNVTNYTASVPFSVAKLEISATPADRAAVNVYSPNLTPGGTTNVSVTVTAENGATKTYVIAVTREQDPNYVASSNNDLSGISVEGFLLSPVFDPAVTNYVIWLPYETESVTIGGTAADRKASVRVEGGESLVPGADNEVKVIVTAEDGTEKVYTVIAKRGPAHDGSTVPAPAEPETEPTTQPTTAPTEPSVPATEPANPSDNQGAGGIAWWVLVIVGVLCLAGGGTAGIFVDKKFLK